MSLKQKVFMLWLKKKLPFVIGVIVVIAVACYFLLK
jgi:hypothetical protein